MTRPSLYDLESLTRAAGKILHDGYEKNHHVQFKGVIDLVTEIDHQSEEYLLGEISRRWPESHVFAEESGESGRAGGLTWYVDPLDGTVNYAHGVPVFCVSIACAWNGQVQLGAVYDPMRDEMFAAERGKGAHLNGRVIHVSKATELQKTLLVTGFPYDTWTALDNNIKHFSKFARMTQGVRRLGSAALDACYVAAGRFDGFWELSLRAWDIAAGALMAEEAGARVTTVKGEADYMIPPHSILASAPGIYDQMLATLNQP